MSVRNRHWRIPTRQTVLVFLLLAMTVFYWCTRPGPPFVVPPYEVGGQLTVVVVDEQDERISNAVVIPNGLRAVQDRGSWYGWQEEEHGRITVARTNEDGVAKLEYPKWVDRKTGLLTEFVPIVVEHPDFCSQDGFECQVPTPGKVTPVTRVRLHRGGRLRITAFHGDSTESLDDFHWYDSKYHRIAGWKTEGGARLTSAYSIGTHILRVVDNAIPESLNFSDPIIFKAVPGQIEDIEVRLRPAMTVRGKLDCPVPVKNGYVIAHVIDTVTDPITGTVEHAEWQTWNPVRDDGEFEFRSLPPSTLVSIQAWCDGFHSQQPPVETIPPYVLRMKAMRSLPQFFSTRDESSFCRVSMTPCGRCEVTVTDSYGLPLEGVHVNFYPNTTVDGYGSRLFGHAVRNENIRPKTDMSYIDRSRDYKKRAADRHESLSPNFGGSTDANGQIEINNLVGRGLQDLYIEHDRFVVRGETVPPFDRNLYADIQPEKTTQITVVMVPKPELTAKLLAPPASSNRWGFVQQMVEQIKSLFE